MKAQDEQTLARWVDAYMARKYARQLNPFFRGTVTAATRVTVGLLTTGYLVSVKRTGETVADGNQYAVLGDYVPVVGDAVECMWRDNASGFVLGPLIPQRSRYRMRATSNATQIVATGTFAKVSLPVVNWDPNKNFDFTTTFLYTVPVSGLYFVGGIVPWAPNAVGRFITLIYVNGAEREGLRASHNVGSSTAPTFLNTPNFTSILTLNAGDTVGLYVWQNTTVNQTIQFGAGNDVSTFDIQFICGL